MFGHKIPNCWMDGGMDEHMNILTDGMRLDGWMLNCLYWFMLLPYTSIIINETLNLECLTVENQTRLPLKE